MAASLAAGLPVFLAAGPERSLTLEIRDYAELPITGKLDGTGQSDGMLARMNSLREEPGGAKRFFINDINGPLYILDKATQNLTTYLDFNGREGHTGLFHKFVFETGWANGLLSNGRYRIPSDNPFMSTEGARKEVWAYGFRNPHRLHFAIDPGDPRNNRLVADSVGLHTWETVNIVHKGANYGYSAREGNSTLKADNQIVRQLPEIDTVPVLVTDTITNGTITPTYPVIQYGHVPGGGDAIGAGFLYNGRIVPALRGKYIFTDITTGRIWYADYKEMLAADDGNPSTMAERHEIKIRWDNPHDTPDAGPKVYDTMFPIAEAAYHCRGGTDPDLPGVSLVSGRGRADAQLGVDAAGELYILTKTDGALRAVVGGTARYAEDADSRRVVALFPGNSAARRDRKTHV